MACLGDADRCAASSCHPPGRSLCGRGFSGPDQIPPAGDIAGGSARGDRPGQYSRHRQRAPELATAAAACAWPDCIRDRSPRAARCDGAADPRGARRNLSTVIENLPSRIEDYGLIGDCETAALVGRDGSIDWLCWPAFDSDACFAAILGTEKHGRWKIAPAEEVGKISRRYWDNTLILETRFETKSGTVAVIDFMPPRGKASDIIRLVRGVSGRVKLRMELVIRFGFGVDIPWVKKDEDGLGLLAICGQDMTVLRTPVETRGEDMTTVADFEVGEGEAVPFVLTYGPSHLDVPEAIDPEQALQDTKDFWTEWSGRCTYKGESRDLVMRSLITLKALTYEPTGGIIAAPTTSLPEILGGAKNWDY